ncbi:glycine receptor subunit alpha-2-like [Penaeus japonicus]|uniref:glycine receptor subunit alpha-2-like n=1 Tax=Penaeus japonicus TaxID=27405 RepID=UPI001C70C463|nr:glycine receptor subunit alpha-2-like [Penaeus japonicus]
MGLMLMLVLGAILTARDSVNCASQTQFLNELLDTYDVNESPHLREGRPTIINVQMFINSFGSLNAANMDFSIDVFLRQSWHDPRLVWPSVRERVAITSPEMLAKLWKPDTYFSNLKDGEIHQVPTPNVLFRIYKTGDVLYSMRTTLSLSCHMEFEEYPLDSQVCGVHVTSYANTDDLVKYQWLQDRPIDLPESLEIAQFDLLGVATSNTTYAYATGNFSGLLVYFNLRRQNGYHVLQTYVPTILIVSISWVSFWLDPNAVPGRITLGVTTLLTLTTLASGIRASLPPVSYVKAIDVWIGSCMIMVFSALVEFTIVNWLFNKKVIHRRQTFFKIPKSPSQPPDDAQASGDQVLTYAHQAQLIDRWSRLIFPAVFFIFNLAYWLCYLAAYM